jgi:hypothetical protein
MTSLLALLLAATTPAPLADAPAPQTVVTCGQSGGVNNGIYVASCLPHMKLLRPTSIDDAKPLLLADGTFFHEFIFEAPKVQSWETTLCAPGLIDFSLAAFSGLSIVMKLESSPAGCITKQFVNVAGVFSVVIHTQGPHPKIEMRTVYIPVNPSVAAQYVPSPIAAEIPYVPVVVMPPAIVSMPVSVGSHGEVGVMPGGVGGVESMPVVR